jgi:hypothetical protein
MNPAVLFLSLSALLPGALGDDAKPRAGRLPATCEVVMSPGMRITATTSAGTIAITAVEELTRSYTWEGATRAVEMEPHRARFFGSFGLFFNAATEHWRDHHGITRCTTKEGQQHNKTVDEAMNWIKEPDRLPSVYRDDGLMVGWRKDLQAKFLDVEVWQILIDGKKPKRLPGSQNDKIRMETVETETSPLVKAVAGNDLAAASALLTKGADANVKNSVGIPVLVMAIRRGSAPMVETLLKNQADPNVRDADTDLTPLWEALNLTPERTEIIKLLLAAGADVNATSRKERDPMKGVTPLMAAVMTGSEDLIQLLLEKGADVNAKTPSGFTALYWAKLLKPEGREGVIRKLAVAGAKE